jgi:hypothetical protein
MRADDEQYVWVYRYRFWDPERGEIVVSDRMATLEAIKSGLGIPALDTGLRVRLEALDIHGHYAVGAGARERGAKA